MTSGSALEAAGENDAGDVAGRARDTVRRTIKALSSYHDLGADELSVILRVSKATAYRKLNGQSEYTAGELAVLAELFTCSVGDFFTGTIKRADVPFLSLAPQANSRRPRVVTGTETHRYSPGSSTHRPALRLVSDATDRYPDVHAGNGSMAPGHGQRTQDDSQESSRAVNDADAA